MKNSIEKIGVLGQLTVKVFNLKNELVSEHTSKNLVVNQGFTSMTKLLGGDDPAIGKPIAYGRVGVGTTAPNATDVNLLSAVAGDFPIDSVSYPDNKSVTFNFSLNYTDANGNDLTEYGLFNEDFLMYTRITKPVISKNSSFRLECAWTLQFSAI